MATSTSRNKEEDDLLFFGAAPGADFHTILVACWSDRHLLLGTPDGLLVYSTHDTLFPHAAAAAASSTADATSGKGGGGGGGVGSREQKRDSDDDEDEDDGFTAVSEGGSATGRSGELKQLYRRYVPGGVRLLSFYQQSSVMLLCGCSPRASGRGEAADTSWGRKVSLVDISATYREGKKVKEKMKEGEDDLTEAMYAYYKYNAVRPTVMAEIAFPDEVGALTFTPHFIIVMTTKKPELEFSSHGGCPHALSSASHSSHNGSGSASKRENLFVYNQRLELLMELTASLPPNVSYCKDVLVSSSCRPSSSLLSGYTQQRAVFPGARVGEICILTTAAAVASSSSSSAGQQGGEIVQHHAVAAPPLLTDVQHVQSHESPMRAICLSADGTAIAAMGDTGTIIQVFVVATSLSAHSHANSKQERSVSKSACAVAAPPAAISPPLLKVEVQVMPLRRGYTLAVIHSVALSILPLSVFKSSPPAGRAAAAVAATQKRQVVFSSSSSSTSASGSSSSSSGFDFVSNPRETASAGAGRAAGQEKGQRDCTNVEKKEKKEKCVYHLVSCLTSSGTIHCYLCDVPRKRLIAEVNDRKSIGAVPANFSLAFATRLQPSTGEESEESQAEDKHHKNEKEEVEWARSMQRLSGTRGVNDWHCTFSLSILHFWVPPPPPLGRAQRGGKDNGDNNNNNSNNNINTNGYGKRPFLLQLSGSVRGKGADASLVFGEKGKREPSKRKILLEELSSTL